MFEPEDKIQQYVLGQLDGVALEAFEKSLKDNPELQNEVRSQMLIYGAAGRVRDEELRDRMNLLERQIDSKPVISFTLVLRWAAVLLLISIPLYYFIVESGTSNKDLYTAYFEPYPNVLGPSRDDDSFGIYGMSEYVAKDYKQAIEKLSNSLSTASQNDAIRLYLGISLMETGQGPEAIRVFDQISDKSRFTHQAKWFSSLAYLAQNKTKAAIRLLEELEHESSYAAQARDLLNEIRS